LRFLTIGLGHCGGKIASTFKTVAMKEQHILMDVCAINTDKSDLASHKAIPEENKLLLGSGRGAAKDWNEGFHAGNQARNNIQNLIRKVLHPHTDIIMLTLGEGGGSGSGLAPIVAEIIGDLGRDCIALATLPFQMESVKAKVNAAKGLDLLYREEAVKNIILIDNDKIVSHYPDKILTDAYQEVNKTTIETFVNLLKLANTPSQADRVDESELRSMFSYPGFATLANYRTYSNMVESLDSMLKHSWEGSLFADVEINTAAGAILGIYGPSSMFTTIQVDKARRVLKEMLVGRDTTLGFYPMEHCRWINYVGLITGLDIPQKVRDLLSTAHNEHKLHEELLEDRRNKKSRGLEFNLSTPSKSDHIKASPIHKPEAYNAPARVFDLEAKASKAMGVRRDVSIYLDDVLSVVKRLEGHELPDYEVLTEVQQYVDISEEDAALCLLHLKEMGNIIQSRIGMLRVI
jgi:tubulin-like protein CetZ